MATQMRRVIMGALQAQVAPTEDLEADGGVEHILLLEYSRCPQEFLLRGLV